MGRVHRKFDFWVVNLLYNNRILNLFLLKLLPVQMDRVINVLHLQFCNITFDRIILKIIFRVLKRTSIVALSIVSKKSGKMKVFSRKFVLILLFGQCILASFSST